MLVRGVLINISPSVTLRHCKIILQFFFGTHKNQIMGERKELFGSQIYRLIYAKWIVCYFQISPTNLTAMTQ